MRAKQIFKNYEKYRDIDDSRKGFIDVLCTDSNNNTFIVEMQNARQEYFRERMIYYCSRLISHQAPIGRWDYKLKPTYVVAFLNFKLEKLSAEFLGSGRFLLHYTAIEETSGDRMPGNPEYIFLGIQDFDKKEDELQTYPEKWLYLFRNTMTLEEVPESFKGDKGFATYFDACERACFSREDDAKYTQDMMNEWDIQNAKDLAVREGRAEGRAEGKAEGRAEGRKEGRKEGREEGLAAGRKEGLEIAAKKMLQSGIDINVISSCTGLKESAIRSL